MDLYEIIPALILAMGIPSALTSFCFRRIEKRMDEREKGYEEKERCREQHEILMVKSIGAAIALGEASALALKNGHTNGETEAALEYAREVKHKQKEFLQEEAIKKIY